MEKEVEFDPATMEIPSEDDILRIFLQFHGVRSKGWKSTKRNKTMEQIITEFAKSHPDGFTEKDLMKTLKSSQWLQATKELYRLALVDRKVITFDFTTGMFHGK